MKSRLTTNQKVFHPVLFGLTHEFDELCKTHQTKEKSAKNKKSNISSSKNLQKKEIHPSESIREPDIHPSKDNQFPNIKKKNIKNYYQKDCNKNKTLNLPSNYVNTNIHTLEEHLICGYEIKGHKINQLILGLESCNGAIRYTGHLIFEDYPTDAFIITNSPKTKNHPFSTNAFMSDNLVIWLKLGLICILQCSEKNEYGLLVTALYRGLKNSLPFKNRYISNSQH